jgi:hypothetical protein
MDIIDYARPTMLAEKALKDMHNAMLEKRYDDAMDHAYKAVECMNEVCIAIHEERRNVRKASTGA